MRAITFLWTYLRNLIDFDGDPVRTRVATRMDMELRERRRRPRGRQ